MTTPKLIVHVTATAGTSSSEATREASRLARRLGVYVIIELNGRDDTLVTGDEYPDTVDGS